MLGLPWRSSSYGSKLSLLRAQASVPGQETNIRRLWGVTIKKEMILNIVKIGASS